MADKYQEYRQNPERMSGRFEAGFPLLYPMDTVQVSSRWAGDSQNPLEGRRGFVGSIKHGIQSRFNRDYLIVGLMGGEELGDARNFESWLYTLDLIEKDETTGIADSVKNQFGCLLYLDDRVRVVNHPTFEGRLGSVSYLSGVGSEGGWLGLEVADEGIIKQIRTLYEGLNQDVEKAFGQRNVPQGFDNFVVRMRTENLAIYEELERIGKTRKTYERLLRDEIYKQEATSPDFQRTLRDLEEKSKFFVSSRDVELVERFPPNDLFEKR